MITLVTAWYNFKNKFNIAQYDIWIGNLLNNCNKFNLIIYTDKYSYPIFQKYEHLFSKTNDNPSPPKANIKIIMREITEFFTYKYNDTPNNWLSNQNNPNNPLKNMVSHDLNMLWNEKINFVYDAYRNNYFNTDYWGWCDIGYFRCRDGLDISSEQLQNWPSEYKINQLNNDFIYYNAVNSLCNHDDRTNLPCCNAGYINKLATFILNKNSNDLPIAPIPTTQISIAGGFFLTHHKNIKSWHNIFYKRLELYFDHNYLIKDDQIIIIDCIVNNYNKFKLIEQPIYGNDRWFSFSTYLL